MPYADPVNMTSVTQMFTYVDSVTDNYFAPALLLSLYIMVMIYQLLKNEDWLNSSISAGFLVFISSLFLRVLQVFQDEKLVIFSFLALAVPAFIKFMKDDSS